jgi:hypothetical protein
LKAIEHTHRKTYKEKQIEGHGETKQRQKEEVHRWTKLCQTVTLVRKRLFFEVST